MDKNSKAIETIEDMKKTVPAFYESLDEKCKVCINILSCEQCEMCTDQDMFTIIGGNDND